MAVFDSMKVLRMAEGEKPKETGWYLTKDNGPVYYNDNECSQSGDSNGYSVERFIFIARIFPDQITDKMADHRREALDMLERRVKALEDNTKRIEKRLIQTGNY